MLVKNEYIPNFQTKMYFNKLFFMFQSDNTNNRGILRHIGLIFHGTKEFPELYTRGRQYYDFNLPDDDY